MAGRHAARSRAIRIGRRLFLPGLCRAAHAGCKGRQEGHRQIQPARHRCDHLYVGQLMARRESVAGTALDPVIEFATLEIDGETYHLAYDFNAIAEAEKLAEANLLHGMAALMFNSTTAVQLRGLFYAGLRKAHPKMTLA